MSRSSAVTLYKSSTGMSFSTPITNVLVKTGDAVVKDQPLLTIQSADADAAMSAFLSARAAVTQARAAVTKAQADFDRSSDLFEHNAVAKKDVLAAESALAGDLPRHGIHVARICGRERDLQADSFPKAALHCPSSAIGVRTSRIQAR